MVNTKVLIVIGIFCMMLEGIKTVLTKHGFWAIQTDYLTIDGNRTIYRIEKRQVGGAWKFHYNSNEPLDVLLDKYKDNEFFEYRIKNFDMSRKVNL